MAKMESSFLFTGSIDNLSAYKMRGSDKIIVRRKGGPTKKKIQTGRNFERLRRNNMEFGGRATASKWIMRVLHPIKNLADYNIAGPINTLLRPVQEMDTINAWGQRSICLTASPSILEGFSLNRQNPLETIIRNPMQYTLDRNTLSASLDIPALIPGINFFVPWNYPMYRIQVVLGIVPDLYYNDSWKKYTAGENFERAAHEYTQTEWLPVLQGSAAKRLEISLPEITNNSGFTLLLSVGICYGNIGNGGAIEKVVHAGAAKILATA